MKKLRPRIINLFGSICLLLALTLALSPRRGEAQVIPPAPAVPTNLPPTTPQGIMTSVIGYFGTHNPELAGAFTNRKGEIWAGADYQNQVNISSSIGLEYNVWTPGTNHYVALESVTRNAGIAGTIVSEQLDVKWKVVVQGDVELGFFVGGGYDLHPVKTPLFTVGADLKKALTQNTFGGLRIENQFRKKLSSTPVISVLMGINF